MVYVGLGVEVDNVIQLHDPTITWIAWLNNIDLVFTSYREFMVVDILMCSIAGVDDDSATYYHQLYDNNLDLIDIVKSLPTPPSLLEIPDIIEDNLVGVLPLRINANTLFGRDVEHQISLLLMRVD